MRNNFRLQQAAAPAPGSPVSGTSSWLATTCLAALSTLVELFSRFYSTVESLLPDLLELINSCVDQVRRGTRARPCRLSFLVSFD